MAADARCYAKARIMYYTVLLSADHAQLKEGEEGPEGACHGIYLFETDRRR